MSPKFQLSRDSQALYITIVAKERLPIFQTDGIRLVTCHALDEARKSGNFLIFAYVIMPDHLHLLTDCPDTSSDVLRRIKGLTARRVIDYLKEQAFRLRLPSYATKSGKGNIAIRSGSKRRMFCRSSARACSC